MREKNKAVYEIDHPIYIKGDIMAEPKIETIVETVETPVEKTSRFQSFTLNHPRTAKVVGIAAITAATLGAIQLWKNRQQDDNSMETDETDDSFDTSSEIA